MTHTAVARVVTLAALLAWSAFWFWAFSFAYSDSFFEFNRHSRIPTFVAVLVAAIALPVSAVYWWLRSSGGLRSVIGHVVTCLAVLALPVVVATILSRSDSPWRLEADDAMGVGIDFLILLGIAIASVVVMVGSLGVRSYRRRSHHRAGVV